MTYRWVYTNDFQQKLYDVGVLPDGTLHNPNNYPEDLVRESIAGAVLRRREKRSNAAKQAAITREKRKQLMVRKVARRLLRSEQVKPSPNCVICGKGLGDREINRKIDRQRLLATRIAGNHRASRRERVMKFTITITDFRPLRRNTLRGYATIRIDELKLSVCDLAIYEHSNGSRWVGLPAKPVLDSAGSPSASQRWRSNIRSRCSASITARSGTPSRQR